MIKQIKINALLALYGIIVCALFVLIQISGRFGLATFNGVFQAVQFFFCLLMVITDNRKGQVVANVILGLSFLTMLFTIVVVKNLAPLPGIANLAIYLFILNFLCIQLKAREVEIVTDFVTGFENMRGLYEHLIDMTQIDDPCYLVSFSLENYSVINEGYGHLYGEQILKLASKRIKDNAKKGTPLFRIREDEFAMIIPETEDSYAVVQQILEELNEKYKVSVNGKTINSQINAYAGLAMFPYDTKNPDELIKYAGVARVRASEKKGDGICYFDKQLMLTATANI